MPRFEVFIPAAMQGEFNVTLRVEADHWMAALKTGMRKLGEQGPAVANIMVDIVEDNSIHVTDNDTRRVFRIKELEEGAALGPASPHGPSPAPGPSAGAAPPTALPAAALPAPTPIPLTPALEPIPLTPTTLPIPLVPSVARAPAPAPIPLQPAAGPLPWGPGPEPIPLKPAAGPHAPAPVPEPIPLKPAAGPLAPAPVPEPIPWKPAVEAFPGAPQPLPVVSAPPVASAEGAGATGSRSKRRAPPVGDAPKVIVSGLPGAIPSEPRQAGRTSAEARRVEQVERPAQPVTGPIGRTRAGAQLEDVLSDLFERTQEVYGKGREDGLRFLLDLALEKIPADSGSVFVSDFHLNDVYLATARGPKSGELMKMKLRLPMGVGVVGFCTQEAVGVALSDCERDPRFYREVSEKIGYPTKSILCAPMVSGGRSFGCVEIINKKGTSHFSDEEMSILNYVAHQGARFLEQQS